MSLKKEFFSFLIIFCCFSSHGESQIKLSTSDLVNIKTSKPDTNTINKLFDFYMQHRQSEPVLSLESLQSAIDIAEVIGDQGKVGWLLYHKGFVYRHMGIYNLAALCYLKSLEIFEKQGNKNFHAWIMIDIGNLYLDQKNNLNISLDHFKKAKEVFLQLDNKIGVIVSDYCIGQIYLERKDFEKALTSFNAAATLSHTINEPKHEAVALSFLGETYLRDNRIDKALEIYNVGLKVSHQAHDQEGTARLYNNLAGAYETIGNISESITNHSKALHAYLSIPDKFKTATTLNKIGKLHEIQGNTNKAIEYAKQALAVADSNNLIGQQELVLPMLANYYMKINKVREAFHYLKRYTDLKESNINKNTQQIEHEYELQLLKKEKLLSEEIVRRQKTITRLSIASVLVFLILAGLIFMKNKKLNESYHHLYSNYLLLSKKDEEIEDIKKQTKYVTSSLKDQQQTDLLNKLNVLMDEKVFLRKELNLDVLADELGTNRSYLSQVINDQYGSNFNNFINKHRIKDAQKLLLDPTQKMLTIEAIAQNVGFNSKSSFNLAFKKVTGLTPSDFIKMKEEES